MTTPEVLPDLIDPSLAANDPNLYVDRELSLLAFQRRVLDEAQRSRQSAAGAREVSLDSVLESGRVLHGARRGAEAESGHQRHRWLARSIWSGFARAVKLIFAEAYQTWREMEAALQAAGIELREYSQLTNRERGSMESYFRQVVYPVLTPLAFDPGRPFPHISNLSLNLAVAVRDSKGVERFARVKVPDTLPQLVPVPQEPSSGGGR